MAIKNNLLTEKDYQAYILEKLNTENNYLIRNSKTDYERGYAMDSDLLFRFIMDSQPETYAKLEKRYKERTQKTILNCINSEINKKNRSLLDVLKTDVVFDNGITLYLMYRKPATTYNAKAVVLYEKNIFSVMEEVYHKDDERIDLVIFLNGLAIFTFELKCNTSGQNYEKAIFQYKRERDYKTRLTTFKSGCIVHFAMDLNDVYMSTHLKGPSTHFLPFNKGNNKGKGNPHNEKGLNVSYMWEDILKKDTILELIDKFIFIDKSTKKKPDTKKIKAKEALIFPRYHQFNAVRRLLLDIKENHTENNYLIEHSAGSGKTNTIAWLAHRLASLHDNEDNNVFDNIVIMTDRIVVDRQLQDAVRAIKHKEGMIKVLDDSCNANDLAIALTGNTKIVVTTIHKFIYIKDSIRDLKDKNFAVIIDEAHSSTAGTAMESVTNALSSGTTEEDQTMQDLIEDEIKRNGKQKNVSMIAFTATPKPTTLQLFGSMNEEGKKVAFDLYSMKQAIEEDFILDVLQNYTTYKTYFKINKAIEDDPELDTITAKRKIAKYIELHDTNIAQKVEIIIENFKNNIMHELGDKAKAMVVTSSRQAAVKYKLEFDRYVKTHGYTNIHALIAFSDQVKIDGKNYTGKSMTSISDKKIPATFDTDNYQLLLVANKYQTGFDQPKLCAMYVDKKLHGINAVQTLSRLNRIYKPYNKKTFILDFKNDYNDIQSAFAPFYEDTVLGETITPSDIRAVEAQVDRYEFLDYDDINDFNEYLYLGKRSKREQEKMWNLLDKALERIKKYTELEKMEIKATIKRFNRFYCFLIQATSFENIDLHKKYNFLTYLIKEIEISSGGNDFNIADKITASAFRQTKLGENLTYEIAAESAVYLPTPNEVFFDEITKKKLSEIIDEINKLHNQNFDNDVVSKSVLQIRGILLKDEDLKASAISNTLADFRFKYNDQVKEALLEGYEQNTEFYNLLLSNKEQQKNVMHLFLEEIYKKLRT